LAERARALAFARLRARMLTIVTLVKIRGIHNQSAGSFPEGRAIIEKNQQNARCIEEIAQKRPQAVVFAE
jgi:hypothetical protein